MYKRFGFVLLATASLLATALRLMPLPVAAAGETYTWKDYNTITVSGGDLKGSAELKLIQGTNPQKFAATGKTNNKAGCDLQLTLTLNSDTSATLHAPLPVHSDSSVIAPEGAVYCSDMKVKEVCSGVWPFQSCHYEDDGPRFPGVAAGYDGKQITVSGTRPGSGNQSENQDDQRVTVIVYSPNPNSSSPDTITVQIKEVGGKVLFSSDVKKEASLGSTDPNSDTYVDPQYQPVSYTTRFYLPPGDYLACASIVIQDCKKFTKVKLGQEGYGAMVLQYGDDSTKRQIKVNVVANYAGGPKDMTVGPFDVTLRKPGGQVVSQQTDTASHKMTNEEEQADGLVTVEYTFTTSTTFNGLDPATYEICVVGVADCQDVTKAAGSAAEVTFTLDWNAFDGSVGAERDCTDKYEVMGVRAFTFVVCSAIDTGTYAVGVLDNVIGALLTVDVKDIFGDKGTGVAYHNAWNSFRAFALGLLIIAALIMVVSQALGLEIVDAYTIRKVLPRLLFAAIFISLSWSILELLTQLSNDAGNGMRELIYAPFKGMANLGGSIAGGSIVSLTLIGTGGALAFGWIGLLSFVLTGLLSSLVAAAVLILRKMLILLIVMMAPFAIAASVLPNTRKMYEVWKNTLVALLVVFPIITSFIAVGRVFSTVAFHSPGSQTINQLIAVIAYFAPYFLITTAFKMAGGAIAQVAGMLNDRSKGAFDRLSNYRANKVSTNMSNMARGQRFQGSNPLARSFNATTFGATTLAKSKVKGTVLNPFSYATRSGRQRARMAWSNAAGQQRNLYAKQYAKSDAAQVSRFNDALLRAQTYANAAEALAHMSTDFGMDENDVKRAVSAARANGGFGQMQQINAVNALFSTGTGYDNLRQAVESIHRVSGDNEEIAMGLIGSGNATSGDVGRADLRPSFGEYVRLYNAMRERGEVTNDEIQDAYVQALKENDMFGPNGIVRGKPKAVQNLAPALAKAIKDTELVANDPSAGYNAAGESLQELAKVELGRLTGMADQMQQGAGMYASALIKTSTQQMHDDTRDIRREVEAAAAPYQTVVNPVSEQLEPVKMPDPTDPTGRRTMPQYKTPDSEIAFGYNEQRPSDRRRGR